MPGYVILFVFIVDAVMCSYVLERYLHSPGSYLDVVLLEKICNWKVRLTEI